VKCNSGRKNQKKFIRKFPGVQVPNRNTIHNGVVLGYFGIRIALPLPDSSLGLFIEIVSEKLLQYFTYW
jgi:hypothetical protein